MSSKDEDGLGNEDFFKIKMTSYQRKYKALAHTAIREHASSYVLITNELTGFCVLAPVLRNSY